jgi:tetratricopeptide (TPR) repeat protein
MEGWMSGHFSRAALQALLQGQGSTEELTQAVQHLTDCRRCRALAADSQLHERGSDGPPLLHPRDARNALALLAEAGVRRSIETLRARSWWAEIRDLGPSEQIRKLRSTASFQTVTLFETILADARGTGRSDPFLGESLVRAAMTVADLLPESRCSAASKNDLRAQALTVVANCRRLAADFQGATEALEEARRFLAQGAGDPAAEAGLLSIHCSVCTDLGDFDAALAHVRRAVEIFRELEDWKSFAHNRVKEAGCLFAAYRPAEAIEQARFALERMPRDEIRLRILAQLIITKSFLLLHCPAQALHEYAEARSVFEQADPVTRLQFAEVEAQLLDAFGYNRESEKLFRHTIRAYLDQELYKQAFLTLLILFESLCRRGALQKAAALCEEAIAATSEAGEACNEQIRLAWEELLTVVRVRQLSESELIQARQFLVRNWSVPAGAFLLPRVETVTAPARTAALLEIPEPPPLPSGEEATPGSYRTALQIYEKVLIETALKQTRGNRTEACRLLGVWPNTLKKKMREFGL